MDAKKFDKQLKKNDEFDAQKEFDTKFLEEMDVSDGKQRDIENLKRFEDLLGTKSMNPFGTLNLETFKEKLAEMNKSDLQSLAMRVGVPPTRDVHDLRKSLTKEFNHFTRYTSSGGNITAKPIVDPSSPEYKKVVKLLE